MTPKCSNLVQGVTWDILETTWFWGSGSQVRVMVMFEATAIRRGFELYECLLDLLLVIIL